MKQNGLPVFLRAAPWFQDHENCAAGLPVERTLAYGGDAQSGMAQDGARCQ
jgi:hypothetical protein